jgi:putative hydrolase of the HAD superfamily
MKNTELIIFDLGRVLLDFDFMKVIRRLQRHSPMTALQIRAYFKTTPLWDKFERGTVEPDAFFRALAKDLKLKDMDFKTFVPVWNEIFEEIDETVAIAKKLKKRYRLAMISNVNPMHWDHVQKNHAFMKWFEHPIASYAVGHRKPELEIYQLTLKRARVPAERAIFIDDVKAHIIAAKSLGIRGHHFISPKKLKKDLDGVLE